MSEFDSWPHVIIEDRDLRLTVLLPDLLRGYYRGPRFEWAGMVALAEWKGHTFFGSWRQGPHRPRANDDAAGTAGEFGMGPLTGNPAPLGYDDATVGETFIKIGVGRLVKPTEPGYSFGALYGMARPAAWGLEQDRLSITFTEEAGPLSGFAYRYTCTVTVSPGGSGFAVRRRLQNLGTRPIVQTHYCHNFIRIDDEPVGSRYRVDLPFRPVFLESASDILRPNGTTIELARAPGPEEGFFALVGGHAARRSENVVTVRTDRAGLRMSGDQPIARLQLFGTGRTICPEPFVALDVVPGKEIEFSTVYQFLA